MCGCSENFTGAVFYLAETEELRTGSEFWTGSLEGPNLKQFSYSLRCRCQTDYEMEEI
jgi:hypothetical protein